MHFLTRFMMCLALEDDNGLLQSTLRFKLKVNCILANERCSNMGFPDYHLILYLLFQKIAHDGPQVLKKDPQLRGLGLPQLEDEVECLLP